jgi:hypothetical protein
VRSGYPSRYKSIRPSRPRERMVIDCRFALNGEPLSSFQLGAQQFPAFSGLGIQANKRQFACLKGSGPIPPGRYYILDRQSGGRLGALYDLFNENREWLALYADDGKIDDEVFCESVKRGNFRLHPKGPLGRSEGCITINELPHFQRVRALLRASTPMAIPGSGLTAFGKVIVE